MNKDAMHLTRRMKQTLILTAMGLTAKEIGAALKVTPRTVRHYQAELKRYLSADSLAHLVTLAIRRGLVSLIRKEFCPNCEKDTECIHAAELYECQECGEDFAKYIVSRKASVPDVSTSLNDDDLDDLNSENPMADIEL